MVIVGIFLECICSRPAFDGSFLQQSTHAGRHQKDILRSYVSTKRIIPCGRGANRTPTHACIRRGRTAQIFFVREIASLWADLTGSTVKSASCVMLIEDDVT